MSETEPAPGSREAIARDVPGPRSSTGVARGPCMGNRPSIARRTARCTAAPGQTTKSERGLSE
jgi:hypothetical protein